ncbi:MAG: SagB/ThcOx family dehydrogenase [Deltaproteobacteria bacterium]|nr:SagB/ThcOx family dehydrogenase [Deltaproteobacteria bacterium]MBW1863469.1 SagB/ThcOx family dehydrogenase [Deltaproteobacteria bacterium]
MKLPRIQTDGNISLEKCIKNRRSIRTFISRPLNLEHISQLLWAGQGITGDRGFKRATPSGGALYPMEIYTVIGGNGVQDLEAGIYHYEPGTHTISLNSGGDPRDRVARAALSQMWMADAPINMVITAEYRRICIKYGERGMRYAMIEAGHIGQNIFLQAEALGLSAGIVGAFQDNILIKSMGIPKDHEPLLVMPVGYEN